MPSGLVSLYLTPGTLDVDGATATTGPREDGDDDSENDGDNGGDDGSHGDGDGHSVGTDRYSRRRKPDRE